MTDRRYGISGITVPDTTLAEDVALAAAAGCSSIGVWGYKLARHPGGVRAARLLLDDHGLTAANCVPDGDSVFPYALAPDPTGEAERVEALLPRIAEMALLAPESVVTITGPAPAGVDRRRAWDVVRAGLERVSAAAVDAGVRIGLEPMHPSCAPELSIVDSLDGAARLVEGLRGIGLLWTPGMWRTSRSSR